MLMSTPLSSSIIATRLDRLSGLLSYTITPEAPAASHRPIWGEGGSFVILLINSRMNGYISQTVPKPEDRFHNFLNNFLS